MNGATSRETRKIVSRAFETALGGMVACAAEEGVCLLEFDDRRALAREMEDVRRLGGGEIVEAADAGAGLDRARERLDSIEAELSEYFEGARRAFATPLLIEGTPWERAVWGRLLEIPYGQTRSYEDIALELGRPGAQRAVGMANGRNRIAIVVPCHRVVEKGGGLRGYGGGLWRKERLLEIEGRGMGERLW